MKRLLSLRPGAAIALIAFATPLLASIAPAQGYKLNGPLAVPITGSLREVQITPDAARAVYLADQVAHGVFELHSVATDGGLASVRLSCPLAAGGNVRFFALAPDGGHVVFTADHATNNVFELFIAPVDGSAPALRLNGPLVPGGSVGRDSDTTPPFLISPDGTHVVYRADQGADEVHELFSVSIAPEVGSPVRLNDPLGGSSDVDSVFRIGSDGLRVVYRVYPAPSGGGEIFSVPIDRSSSPVTLNGPLVAGRFTVQFEITPDASRVVYRADQEIDNKFELFSVPIAGGATPKKLATPGWPGAFEAFLLSPDSQRVVYPEIEGPPWSRHLESVPVDGSRPAITLSGPFYMFAKIEFSPDGDRVVYMGARAANDVYELFSVPSYRRKGGTKLNGPLAADASVYDFQIAVDSEKVVYRTEKYGGGVVELFSVPIDGGKFLRASLLGRERAVKLNDPLVPSGYPELHDFLIDAGSTTVFYLAREIPEEWISLYRVPIDGSASSVRLNGTTREEWVESFQLAPDGRVFYRDHQDNPFAFQPDALKAVVPDGTQAPVRITPVLANHGTAGDVFDFQTSSDGTWTVYVATQESVYAEELFGVPTDGCLAPVKLNDAFPQQDIPGGISELVISPDGERVAYVPAFGGSIRGEELFCGPVDGSTPSARLCGPVPDGADLHSFRFGPDSGHVFYVLDQDVNEVHQLFRAPADGSGPALRLNAPLVAGGDVWSDFRITPDGAAVAYVADQTTNDVFELFVVPSDGSVAPVRLSAPLVAGGDVGSSGAGFEIGADGARLVYAADQRVNDVVELFSVPLDQSAAPVPLNGPLVAGGDLRAFGLDPTSTWVVYLADQEADERFELFSVPIDASLAPVKLNGPLVAGGDIIGSFLISPDGQRVVYVADQAVDETFELFAAPIDGGQAAVRLNGPLVAGGDVAVFSQGAGYPPIFRRPEITPDGARVVYVANEETLSTELFSVPIDGAQPSVKVSSGAIVSVAVHPDSTRVVYVTPQDELFVAPIDGSQAPIGLAGSLAADFEFGPRISPDGSRVLYRAQQDTPGVTELYAIPLP